MANTKLGPSTILLNLVIVVIVSFDPTESVILPPKLYSTQPDLSTFDKLNISKEIDPPPYAISINEGYSLEVATNSSSAITINLNRPVAVDIIVIVSVFSGPNLVSFNSSKTHTKNVNLTFKANTFGDRAVKFYTSSAAGHAELVCKVLDKPKNIDIDDTQSYISVNINKSWRVNILVSIVGWVYFLAWSLSFYFQVILNYQRKSVIGLNFDFMALNLIGFTFYSIYNFTIMFSHDVQRDYYERYTYSRIPVEYNDLFFSAHAFILTAITVIQCCIYERGQQKVSGLASIFIGLSLSGGVGLAIAHLFLAVSILDVVLYLSYVKLVITVIKYTPQAYMNYQRKATTGWSIHNILLDFTGGALSIAQMFLLAYNYDDWVSIFGNFTKFGLGVVSIIFDILFVVQHYVLYRQAGELGDSTDSIPSPIISESIRSTNYVSPQQQPVDGRSQEGDM